MMRNPDGAAALDSLLEHRARLAVCVLLSRHEAITVAGFKQLLDLTDGNLVAQLRKLEGAGRRALKAHLAALQALVAAAAV